MSGEYMARVFRAHPAVFNPVTALAAPGDLVVQDEGDGLASYGIVRLIGGALRVEVVRPTVTVAAAESAPGGAGVAQLRMSATNANGDEVQGVFCVTFAAAADPITLVAPGTDGTILWTIGEGTDHVIAYVQTSVAGFADVRVTGTVADTADYTVMCVSSPATPVSQALEFPA